MQGEKNHNNFAVLINKKIYIMQTAALNPAQREILNLMSCLGNDEDLTELKKLLVTFLNERLQRELDVLWDNGTLDDKVLETLLHEHIRTPYK